jgi:hypothetical protein
MLLGHIAALPGAWCGVSDGGDAVSAGLRVGLLAVSSVFFVLKVLDVAWLRLKPGWRPAAAAFVVVSLLHVGVIERSSGVDVTDPLRFGLVLSLATVLEADDLRNAIRRLPRLRLPPRLTRVRPILDLCWERARESLLRPATPLLSSSHSTRAPPRA